MYCIDASVLTNSQMEHEEFHEYSKKLMGIIKDKGITVGIHSRNRIARNHIWPSQGY